MPEEVSPQHDNAVSKPLDSLQDVIHKTRSDISLFSQIVAGSSWVRASRKPIPGNSRYTTDTHELALGRYVLSTSRNVLSFSTAAM
jgi:hypothetical protein